MEITLRVPPAGSVSYRPAVKAPPRFHCSNNANGGAALKFERGTMSPQQEAVLILIATWLAVAVVLAFVLAGCAVPLR